MDELNKLLNKNTVLHTIIENEVRLTPFGQITFNVQLKEGEAIIETINIVKQRRRKYQLDSSGSK